jgi:hypothetical protein
VRRPTTRDTSSMVAFMSERSNFIVSERVTVLLSSCDAAA